MTWQDAKQDAQKLVDRVVSNHKRGDSVVLTEFESAQTYRLLRGPDDPPAWNYHCQVIRAAARLLRRPPHGLRVRVVTLTQEGYFRWLTDSDRDHSPESVSQYSATLP